MFIYDLVILADQVDIITVLPMLTKKGDPIETVTLCPVTVVEEFLALIQYQERLVFLDISFFITLMELHGKRVETVQIGIMSLRYHALESFPISRVDSHPVRIAVCEPFLIAHIDEPAEPLRVLCTVKVALIDRKVCDHVLTFPYGIMDLRGHMEGFPGSGRPCIEKDHSTHLPSFMPAVCR